MVQVWTYVWGDIASATLRGRAGSRKCRIGAWRTETRDTSQRYSHRNLCEAKLSKYDYE